MGIPYDSPSSVHFQMGIGAPLRTVIPAFGATPQYYSYKEPNDCTADCNLNVNSGVQQQGVPEWLVAQKAQDLEQRQHYDCK